MDDNKKDINKSEEDKNTADNNTSGISSSLNGKNESVNDTDVEEAIKDMPPEVRRSFRWL